jgi:hypothetical protein
LMSKTVMPPKRNTRYPDDFQTPPEALEPLLPFIPRTWKVWEPACGKGYLVNRLRKLGYGVVATDILLGQDFLTYEPAERWDVIVTNPPYSLRYEFIKRCYEFGRPWAMLMTLTTIEGRRQRLFEEHGIEIMFLDRRINFETPNRPAGSSRSWFPVAWFCWKLLPKPILFGKVPRAVCVGRGR